MDWNKVFDANHVPSNEDIRDYLGGAKSASPFAPFIRPDWRRCSNEYL